MTAVLLAVWLGVAAAPGDGFALAPGHDRAFASAMPAQPGELPAGWGIRHLSVPTDHVLALYGPAGSATMTCDDAPLCVRLVHPTAASPGARRAGFFAIEVGGPAATEATGLVGGVEARLVEVIGKDPWKAIQAKLPEAPAPRAAPAAVDAQDRAAAYGALLATDPDLTARIVQVEPGPKRVRYHLRTDDGGVAIVTLRARSPRQSDPTEVTRSFFVEGLGPLPHPPDLVERVRTAVAQADDGSLALDTDVMATGERTWLHWVLIVLSALCLLMLVAGLPRLLAASWSTLGPDRLVWILLGLGVALRLALPYRLVEMGIGYQLARLADELALPRYGAGTTTLHHVVFQAFGSDHVVMIWTHKIMACLTLPLAAAAGARLMGDLRSRHPAALLLWAAALVLTPMLVRSDLTESNLVPVLFALWAALLSWQATTGWTRVALTAAGLAFAGLSRPEMALVAPGIWLLLTHPWRTWRPAAVVLGLVAVAMAFQLTFVDHVVAWETAEGSLHLSKGLSLERLVRAAGQNALFDPRIVPVMVPVLGLISLLFAPLRRWALVLLVGGLAWLYVYGVDLSQASMPRLHIVGLLPWSLVAAVVVAAVHARRRAWGWILAAAWLASAAATVPALWAPTNEDTQESLYDAVSESLPLDEPYFLAVLTASDAPDEPGHFTHRHLPIYRFEPGSIVSLGAIGGALERARSSGATVYVHQGVGCYAQLLRSRGQERGLLPACEAVQAHFELAPVWVDEVPNHGNPVHQELGYYSDEARFQVGLWKVVGARAH